MTQTIPFLCAFFGVIAGAVAEAPLIIPVNSPAFVFSPGNWTGDAGRAGSDFRQTWYPGAYFRLSWTSPSPSPKAEILLDASGYEGALKTNPVLTYEIDGVWKADVPCDARVPINGLTGSGAHTLAVYVQTTEQTNRWGGPGASGRNVVRVKGLEVDAGSKPLPARAGARWALIVGDSITEGNAANFGKSDSLASWGYFVGRGLQAIGYEYGFSACGYSGWLRPGDATGDVPAYYFLSDSTTGNGGHYDDARSRWNKIDGNNHSLLDAAGRLSGYGAAGQEPELILINYGTNDGLKKVNVSDLQASITRGVEALRKAAPDASIFLIVPFGQYEVKPILAAAGTYRARFPKDRKVTVIDLGASVARTLAANGYWAGLHPNMRAHAQFAAEILAPILAAGR